MIVKILQPGDEALLERFLRPRVATSMFLLNNLRQAGFIDQGQVFQGTYVAAVEADEIVGVAAHYWNGILVCQAPAEIDSLWPAALSASQRPLEGLIGPGDQVERIYTALTPDPNHVQLDSTDRLYVLQLNDLIVPALLANDQFQARRIRRSDVALMTDWRVAYAIEALGAEETPHLRSRSQTDIEQAMDDGTMWVLEQAGEPVACTAFNAVIPEAVQVGGVWTPPDLRGQGYGRAAVAASLIEARDAGVGTAILFTDEQNLPAHRAYLALGFEVTGDYRIVLFQPPLETETQ